ncbi:rCG37483 [Rattus norvegicus]|uniref:RCG37483 n=1 Tax=Rattus norvegicus TaxID=10116 RepID=A6KIA4_RAT|nr:rCG37483 [Rattus norvegicus]
MLSFRKMCTTYVLSVKELSTYRKSPLIKHSEKKRTKKKKKFWFDQSFFGIYARWILAEPTLHCGYVFVFTRC